MPDTLKYFTIKADRLKIKFFCVLFLYCFCYPKLLTYLKVSILHRILALVIKSNINGILIPCMSRFSEKEMLPNCWCHIVGKIIFIQNKIWYSLYILHKLFLQAFYKPLVYWDESILQGLPTIYYISYLGLKYNGNALHYLLHDGQRL